VYWYGAKTPTDYYSFVTKSAFMAKGKDYEKHMKKHETAQAKDDEFARKYKEMQEDLLKAPENRKRGGFQERYELLGMSDVESVISDANESEDDDSSEEKSESKLASRNKGHTATVDANEISRGKETGNQCRDDARGMDIL
jgi:hypothetical protein